MSKHDKKLPGGANIAGVPIEEPYAGTHTVPGSDGGEPYIPRHLAGEEQHRREGSHAVEPTGGAGYIPQPDGSNIAPNGAVVRDPWSDQPEIKPDYEFTPEKEDLDLLIM